jgi:hypothetical protein
MEAKWPFMLILFGLLFGLGFTIATMERSVIMNDWENRRCDLPIMTAAYFFKPDTDPRTQGQFASENFEFCMKSFVDSFINLFAGPVSAVFSKQVDTASMATNAINTARTIAANLYRSFQKYIGQFFGKFTTAIFEMNRIIQYIGMAFERVNGVIMSMLYSAITVFRGMINSIQFVIRVVMIICAIMLIIIIILFFILFPVMPIILATLGVIVTTVLIMSGILKGSISTKAEEQRRGFCFSEDTMILVRVDGKDVKKAVQDIQLGDELGNDCGKVTALIDMDGSQVKLNNIDGIYVSDSHLVLGIDHVWKEVSTDERAVPTIKTSRIVYCFNTTSNMIPVCGENDIVFFRDWEEIGNDDEEAQTLWNEMIVSMLNPHQKDVPCDISKSCELALMSKDTLVKTRRGFQRICDIAKIGHIILDRNGNAQVIRGVIHAEVEEAQKEQNTWHTELYEEEDGVWTKGKSNVIHGVDNIEGMTLITESGEFIIWDEIDKKEKIIRDFTEVGYHSIHETYSFVAARLRMTKTIKAGDKKSNM